MLRIRHRSTITGQIFATVSIYTTAEHEYTEIGCASLPVKCGLCSLPMPFDTRQIPREAEVPPTNSTNGRRCGRGV
jgi:hypothetical protein